MLFAHWLVSHKYAPIIPFLCKYFYELRKQSLANKCSLLFYSILIPTSMKLADSRFSSFFSLYLLFLKSGEIENKFHKYFLLRLKFYKTYNLTKIYRI